MSFHVITVVRPGWEAWLGQVWSGLAAGQRVEVPTWLPHPAQVGFRRLRISEPNGQAADWALSLSDGSRLHAHEFRSGRLVLHRDQHDPDRGVTSMFVHVATETVAGRTMIAASAIYGGYRLLRSLLPPKARRMRRRRPKRASMRRATRRSSRG